MRSLYDTIAKLVESLENPGNWFYESERRSFEAQLESQSTPLTV